MEYRIVHAFTLPETLFGSLVCGVDIVLDAHVVELARYFHYFIVRMCQIYEAVTA